MADLMNLKKDRQVTLNHMITPTLMPQVSDARITIQTFNAPAAPILPGTIPAPEISFRMKLPENNAPSANKIIIDEKITKEDKAGNQASRIRHVLEEAFFAELEKQFQQPGLGLESRHHRKLRLAILSSRENQQLARQDEAAKVAAISSSLADLHKRYANFQSKLAEKMKAVDFFLGKWTKISLNFVG